MQPNFDWHYPERMKNLRRMRRNWLLICALRWALPVVLVGLFIAWRIG